MRRCNNCQYQNSDDASACARCKQKLEVPVTANAGGKTEAEAPAWLYSLHPAGRPETANATTASSAAETLADAAAMPVQVRRSRVPVLSVDGRRFGPSAAAAIAGRSNAEASADMPPQRSARRLPRAVLILILIVLIAALAFLVGNLAGLRLV